MVQHYQDKNVTGVDIEDVWLGNGVSELIVMSLQALLNNGDEVLVPAARLSVVDGRGQPVRRPAVHYLCDESADWQPDLDDIAAKITPRTRAHRGHQPEQPDRRRVPARDAGAASSSWPAGTT